MNQNKNLEVGQIFQQAFKLLQDHTVFLLLVFLIGFGLNLLAIVPFLGLPFFIPLIALTPGRLFLAVSLIILGLIWFVAIFLIAIWVQAGFVEAVAGLIQKQKSLQPWEPFKIAFRKLWLYFSTSVLAGFFILLGMIFLVIPGILLAIRLFLAMMVVAREDSKAVRALKRSFQLTKGQGFLIFLLIIILMALGVLLSWVPLVGSILANFVSLFGVLLQGVLYQKLSHQSTLKFAKPAG